MFARLAGRFGAVTAVVAAVGLFAAPTGSTAQPSAVEARQDRAKVTASFVTLAQQPPEGAKQGKWGATAHVYVRVPGVKVGQQVEAQFAGANPVIAITMATVDVDGEVTVLAFASLGTLDQVKAAAARISRLSKLTIRVSPDAPPLTVNVPRWTSIGPFLFRDVKMKKVRGQVNFTGRLVTDKGAPASMTTVLVVQFGTAESGGNLSEQVELGRDGRFSVTTNTRPKPGFIGLLAYPSVKAWDGVFRGIGVYSKPFAYNA